RDIEQPGIDRMAEARAQGALPVAAEGQRAEHALVVAEVLAALDIGIVDIALDAPDDMAGLPVVADMDAPEPAIHVKAVRGLPARDIAARAYRLGAPRSARPAG